MSTYEIKRIITLLENAQINKDNLISDVDKIIRSLSIKEKNQYKNEFRSSFDKKINDIVKEFKNEGEEFDYDIEAISEIISNISKPILSKISRTEDFSDFEDINKHIMKEYQSAKPDVESSDFYDMYSEFEKIGKLLDKNINDEITIENISKAVNEIITVIVNKSNLYSDDNSGFIEMMKVNYENLLGIYLPIFKEIVSIYKEYDVK